MKTTLITLLFICTFALSSICPPALAASEQAVIINKPVKVIAKTIIDEETDQNHYKLEMDIEYGSYRFKFQTLLLINNVNFKKAIKYQKSRVHWKTPYLFVGSDNGGGNAVRGNRDIVFLLKKGELLYIGEVDANSFKDRVFRDFYDKFEVNKLTCHAESPIISLVLEKKGGRLKVNLDKTCIENHKAFNDNQRRINYIKAREKLGSESRVEQIVGPLLFNAVISKYCKHEKDANSFVKIAMNELNEDGIRSFNDILAQIIPGELPETAVKVDSY